MLIPPQAIKTNHSPKISPIQLISRTCTKLLTGKAQKRNPQIWDPQRNPNIFEEMAGKMPRKPPQQIEVARMQQKQRIWEEVMQYIVKARKEFTASRDQRRNRKENIYSRADQRNRLMPQAKAPNAPIIVRNLSSILNLANTLQLHDINNPKSTPT